MKRMNRLFVSAVVISLSVGAVVSALGVAAQTGKSPTVVDDLLVRGFLDAWGRAFVRNGTDSNSPDDGALVVAGGVGVGKQLNVREDALFESDVTEFDVEITFERE